MCDLFHKNRQCFKHDNRYLDNPNSIFVNVMNFFFTSWTFHSNTLWYCNILFLHWLSQFVYFCCQILTKVHLLPFTGFRSWVRKPVYNKFYFHKNNVFCWRNNRFCILIVIKCTLLMFKRKISTYHIKVSTCWFGASEFYFLSTDLWRLAIGI